MTRLTAMIIASRDDIIVTAGGPGNDGKYMGWITLGEEDRCRPLLNSEAVYNSFEEAREAMERLVEEVRGKVASGHI